jgi:hypothetical protein
VWIIRSVFIVFLGTATGGCGSIGQRSTAPVHHLVLCWLKESGNEAHRRQIIDVSGTFSRIPGVASVSAGAVMPSNRKIVDDSFDVAIHLTFRDRAALQAYLVHPLHEQAKGNILLPLVSKVVVYDFRE